MKRRTKAPEVEHKRPPQEIKLVDAVAMTLDARHGYRIHYLKIPQSELGKYQVSSDHQDFGMAQMLVSKHFAKEVAKQ